MRKYLWIAMMGLAVIACKEDDDDDMVTPEPAFEVPDTYNFENVSYSGQTDRLNQLEEMTTYMKTGNTPGTVVDASVLQAMFENEGGNGGGNFSFSSTKQLKDKTPSTVTFDFENYFIEMQIASQNSTPAANGSAGVMVSGDGSKSYLFSASGREYTQLIEKGLMGAVFYYQGTTIYMGGDKMNVDNETVEAGEGTAMQHHWDEAYGYIGVSNDFPTNTEDVRFWGKYTVGRDAILGSSEKLSYAMRKGREAINQKDYTRRDEAIVAARKEWELVCAGTAIHYINAALENMGDDLERNHALSEAWAFIGNLYYNEDRLISLDQIDEIRSTHIGFNFYEVTTTGLQDARDMLATIYDLEDKKTLL